MGDRGPDIDGAPLRISVQTHHPHGASAGSPSSARLRPSSPSAKQAAAAALLAPAGQRRLRADAPPASPLGQAPGKGALAPQPTWSDRFSQLAWLVPLVALWYAASWWFSVGLQAWLRAHTDTGSLLAMMVLVYAGNALASAVWLCQLTLLMTGCAARGGTGAGASVAHAWASMWELGAQQPLCFVAANALGILGTASSYLVLRYGSVSLVQLLRCSAPVFSAAWAFIVMGERLQAAPLLGLAATLAGTAMASWREPTLGGPTLALGLCINLTLALRNVLNKHMMTARPHGEREAVASFLLLCLNATGLLVLSGALLAAQLLSAPPGGAALRSAGALLGATAADPAVLLVVGCSFAYNLASQLVLARVHVVSHSMLELCKRIAIMAVVLHAGTVTWQLHNQLGALVAFASVAAYFWANARWPPVKEAGVDKANRARSVAVVLLGMLLLALGASALVAPWPQLSPAARLGALLPAAHAATGAARGGRVTPRPVASAALGRLQQPDAWAPTEPAGRVVQRAARPASLCANWTAPVTGASAALGGLYVGWVGKNNTGDDLVLDLMLQMLRRAILQVTPEGSPREVAVAAGERPLGAMPTACGSQRQDACAFGVVGGGSISSSVYLGYLQHVMEAQRPLLVFGTGVQKSDVDIMAAQPQRNQFLFQLLNGTDPVGGVRGAYSQAAYARMGVRLPVIYDSGVLTAEAYAQPPRGELLSSLGLREGVPLAVATLKQQMGAAVFDRSEGGFNASSVARHAALVVLLRALATTHQVVLQPVDPASVAFHQYMAQQASLQVEGDEELLLPIVVQPDVHAYGVMAAVYAAAQFSVNARLHPGVISASALTPFLLIGNNPKFDDFAASMGMAAYVINPAHMEGVSDTQFAQTILARVRAMEVERAQLVAKLTAKRATVLALYERHMLRLVRRLAAGGGAAALDVLCCPRVRLVRGAMDVPHRAVPLAVECDRSDDGSSRLIDHR